MANPVSDWHEQVEFSIIYFEETKRCREAQRMDILSWAIALQSKISFAAGILDRKDVEKWNKQIDDAVEKVTERKAKEKNKSGLGGYYDCIGSPILNHFNNKLRDVLRNVEFELDNKINKLMPFLNIRKRGSLSDMV